MGEPKKRSDGKFKKGISGNPKGREKLPAEVKAVRYLGHEQIAQMGTVLLEGNFEDLKVIALDTKQPFIKQWTATLALKAMAKGDYRVWDAVLDRVVGKVKERVEFSGDAANPIVVKIAAMTHEERMKLLKDASDDLKDVLDVD